MLTHFDLLNEPFGVQDALKCERLASELLCIWSAQMVTVVMVTHSIPEALLLVDRVVLLSERPRSLQLPHTRRFGDLARKMHEAVG